MANLPPGFILDSPQGGMPEGFELDQPLKDGPNQPESPDDTMQYLAKMARAIYGATPAGAITNLPSAVRGLAGMDQPEGLSPTQSAAAQAGTAARKAAPAALKYAGENLDVMGGAGAGAMAALPFAAAAGPLAPVVPVAGALIGATATRAAVRPMQAALGRPGAPYATAPELEQAGYEGAMQEAGGQMLTGGLKMGLAGLNAAKQAAIAKTKEILPDMGENLIRVPSESINRVLDRFKDFAPTLRGAFRGQRRAAQGATSEYAANSLNTVNKELIKSRRVAGRALEMAENDFIGKAKDIPIVDAGDFNAAVAEWKLANPALADSADAKKIVEAVARYKPRGSVATGISAGEPILAKDAIALRRELDSLSHWNAGGIRAVENDAADRLAKDLAGYIRDNIRNTAGQVNPKYAQRLTEFAEMADAHNNALGTLATASGTDKAIAMKLDNLANMFNGGPGIQDALLNIGQGVRGGKKIQAAVQDLADALAVRSFQKVPKVVPSGVILRIINQLAPTRTAIGKAGAAISGPQATATYKAGPKAIAASRLAAALAAQQTR